MAPLFPLLLRTKTPTLPCLLTTAGSSRLKESPGFAREAQDSRAMVHGHRGSPANRLQPAVHAFHLVHLLLDLVQLRAQLHVFANVEHRFALLRLSLQIGAVVQEQFQDAQLQR